MPQHRRRLRPCEGVPILLMSESGHGRCSGDQHSTASTASRCIMCQQLTVPTGLELAVEECKAILARSAIIIEILQLAKGNRSGGKTRGFLDLYR